MQQVKLCFAFPMQNYTKAGFVRSDVAEILHIIYFKIRYLEIDEQHVYFYASNYICSDIIFNLSLIQLRQFEVGVT